MSKLSHEFRVTVRWSADRQNPPAERRNYSRNHTVTADGPPTLLGSSDPAFRGDSSRWNPELLLVAAISECHMLWYLHVATTQGVTVLDYVDEAEGTLRLNPGGGGEFTSLTLRPQVTIMETDMVDAAVSAHEKAGELCFIARSVNFPVQHEPTITVAAPS